MAEPACCVACVDLADAGLVALDWTLLGASAGPRFERWIRPTASGLAAEQAVAAGDRLPGRPLGPKQLAALAELATTPDGISGPELAGRHGTSSVASLVRRGLAEAETRERPRRPLAARAPGRRGGRPPAADLSTEQQAAVDRATTAIRARDPRPLLLDGVTGGGKTAIYVEAIAAALEAGRPALVLVPEIAMALPLVDRLRADLDARVALVHSGLGDGERADEWRRIRARRRRHRRRARAWRSSSPLADIGLIIVDEEHDPAYKSDRTPRLQARDAAIRLAALAGAAVILGSATPAVETLGPRARRPLRPGRPADAPDRANRPDSRRRRPARRARRGQPRASCRGRSTTRSAAPRHGGRRPGDPRPQPARHARRSCCAATAATSRPAPTASGRSSTTRPARRCAATTAAGRRRSRRAARPARSPRIRYLGGGTERVEREVRAAHPGLRVARLDRDVAERRGAAARVIDAFTAGEMDVLVGTSLVAKGLDVPDGHARRRRVIRRRAQPARRARRGADVPAAPPGGRPRRPRRAPGPGDPPDLPARPPGHRGRRGGDDAAAFYDAELDLRRRFGSPPFGSTVKLTVALADRDAAEREGAAMADRLRERARPRGRRSTSSDRRRPTSRGATTAGGSTWSCAGRTRWPSSAAIPGRRGRSTSTPRSCSSGVQSTLQPVRDRDATDLALEALQAFQLARPRARPGAGPRRSASASTVPQRVGAKHDHDVGAERALRLVDEGELFRLEIGEGPLAAIGGPPERLCADDTPGPSDPVPSDRRSWDDALPTRRTPR